ncbi:hypothetical protein N7638_02705 [Achromobacter mucicolens]|uniref:hypothetical protein n=1 Tax=Achromobacter mucicolens TaxID=1389922 RepID=UPI0024475F78|nr:hypothetical protein [Achromobacter mucicolens]MDG9966933.1 hypothetical protein [Achromobacter mucicolens]
MRVIAIAQGYGGKDKHVLREIGEQFEVPDGVKASWYEAVEDEPAPTGNKKGGGKQQSGHDLA